MSTIKFNSNKIALDASSICIEILFILMKKYINCTFATLIIMMLSSSVALAALKRPIMVASDRQMSAFIDGEKCTHGVKITFKAQSKAEFDRRTGKAARFIGNVTDLLNAQCPILERVSVRGKVKNDILYSGTAEAKTGWVVTELGSDSGGGILSQNALENTTNSKNNFLNAPDFINARNIIAIAQDKRNECVAFETKTKNCLVRNHYSIEANQISLRSESLLNKKGSIAILSYSYSIKDSFLCTDPRKTKVDISGGNMSQESKEDMKEMLIERLNALDGEICTGFKGKASTNLFTQSFGSDGSSQAMEQSSVFSQTPFGLRIED